MKLLRKTNKLKMIFISLLLALTVGCAGTVHPTVSLPTAPEKPIVKSKVIKEGDTFYIAYDVPSWMKIYAYWLERDGYDDKLIFRINQLNKVK